ncbi:MAG: hypothetical protein VW546_06845 [Gammaproteobacteria bacterium]
MNASSRTFPFWTARRAVRSAVSILLVLIVGSARVFAEDAPLSASSGPAVTPQGSESAITLAPQLDFQTLLDFSGTVSGLPSRGNNSDRLGIEPFGVELSDLNDAALRDQSLDELRLYVLEHAPLGANESFAERRRSRWLLLQRAGKRQRLTEELWHAFSNREVHETSELGLRLGSWLLEHGGADDALKVFQEMLATPELDAGSVRQARLGIIEGFLATDDVERADAAALDFQNDYEPKEPSWIVLQARLALRQDDPARAAEMLQDAPSVSTRLWLIFSEWRSLTIEAPVALSRLGAIPIPAESETLERTRTAMVAVIADQPSLAATRVNALERLIEWTEELDPLLALDLPQALLAAYGHIAHTVIQDWGMNSSSAESLWQALWQRGDLSALEERALAVNLIWTGLYPSTPVSGYGWLIRHCLSHQKFELIQMFFGDRGVLANYEALDDGALLILMDEALRNTDFALAAELQRLIRKRPDTIDLGAWVVRTARIQVLGGYPELGADQLDRWLSSLKEISPGSLDRVMQIMFDLQFLEQHELAIKLFQSASRLIRTADQKRELFYWMGQSWLGMGEPARAAAYFLESASLSGPNAVLWRRSALYQAGLALEAAMFFDDAVRVYQQLLSGTNDAKLQAKLQYRLAQIQLARIRQEGQ